jgi:hypothetical protein
MVPRVGASICGEKYGAKRCPRSMQIYYVRVCFLPALVFSESPNADFYFHFYRGGRTEVWQATKGRSVRRVEEDKTICVVVPC